MNPMATGADRLEITTDEPKPSRPKDEDPPPAEGDASASTDQARWADQDEDVRLMLAFKDGDESAFTQLVERNQARI